jgi:FkbM family methyltransferase
MPLFNSLRLFTNKVLAPAGFAVQRVKKNNPWGSAIVTTRIGRFSIRVPRTNQVSTEYQDNPCYMSELAELASLLKKKYPGLSAIDIGANVGDTACIIKTAVDIPLVCIEGNDYTFGLLEENIRQFQNVTAYKLFLGEKTGTMTATFEKAGWNTTIKPGQGDGAQTISLVSLDDFLATKPVASGCKLMKIDTEGFDCSIIRGAAKFLQQSRPALMFEYNRDNMEAIGEKGTDTLAMLRDLGYSQVIFHDCNGRFFTANALSDDALVGDLLDYADGKHGAIYYFDLTMFHREDTDVALEFIKAERARRVNARA